MISTNNDIAARSTASTQKGSTFLLAFVIAVVRAALVVPGAVALGSAVELFFPEMLVLKNAPLALLAVVFIDTFAIVFGLLLLRGNRAHASKNP